MQGQRNQEKTEFDELLDEVRDDMSELASQVPSKKEVKGYVKSKRGKIAMLIGVVAILVIVILVLLPYVQKGKEVREQEKIEKEVAALVKDISVHAIMPEETPVVFTVTDVEALVKEQQFFAGAVNGDKLLIFPQAVKAVIYSPDRDIIVNMGPVTFDQTGAKTQSNTQATQQQFTPSDVPETEALAPEQAGGSDN